MNPLEWERKHQIALILAAIVGAAAVAEVAYRRDLAIEPRPEDLLAYVKSKQYQPRYQSYV